MNEKEILAMVAVGIIGALFLILGILLLDINGGRLESIELLWDPFEEKVSEAAVIVISVGAAMVVGSLLGLYVFIKEPGGSTRYKGQGR